jgi:hypothetical protein
MSEQQTLRSISQILRRHGPQSLIYIDEYGVVGKVTTIRADVDTDVNRRRLHRRVKDRMERWQENGGRVFGVADIDRITEKDIAALRPRQIEWEPYGEWYACKRRSTCGVLHKETDADFDGRCRLCRGPLDQLPYVYYHHCGSFDELKPQPNTQCPTHGFRFIAFHDAGDLAKSSWVCRSRGCAHRKRAFYPPCNLPACKAVPGDHKRYQISHYRDQWVYYAQTVDFVNLDDGQAMPFVNSEFGCDLIHSAVLGGVPAGGRRLAATLKSAGGDCPHCGFKVTPGAKFCSNCGGKLPDAGGGGVKIPIEIDHGRVTWAMLRDLEESRSAMEAAAACKASGVENSLTRGVDAMPKHGIHDIVLVNSFPLTTGLMGYTRNRSDHQAWLRIFPRRDEKYVVYTNSVGTEAWMVQLSAAAIVEWLRANGLAASDGTLPTSTDEAQIKTWLIEKIVAGDDIIIAAVEPLLHTFSHVVLYSLAGACGLEAASLGELIMPDALAVAIYAGDSELGALTAAFDQMLDVVMDGVTDFSSCRFDPSCREDDKGACVGCIHMPRGCQQFNDRLSRAYLFGGPVPSPLLTAVRGFLGVAAAI